MNDDVGMDLSVGDRVALANQEVRRLGEQGVRLVALSWVDSAGLSRAKAVPLARLPDVARWGVGMSPVFDTFLSDDSRAEAAGIGGPVGDLRLVPDLARATRLAGQPGWAWAPVDRYGLDGRPHAGCHRSMAARMMQEASDRGLRLHAGFETEWTVGADRPVAEAGNAEPVRTGAGPAYGMARLTDVGPYLLDIADALAAQNVELSQIHPEYEEGQFEVSTIAEDPVGAADTAVLVRHTLRAVSRSHGLRPSFAPLSVLGGSGNGGHLHLSLWRGDRNLFQGGPGPHGMTSEGEAFLAGVLRELPALTAIGCPTPASYLRLAPSQWAGAHQAWGWENREAAIRFITGTTGQAGAANAEVKCFDEAANPYLTVGAVIAAGLAAFDEGARLPAECTTDPRHTDGIDKEGGVRRLPTTLAEAVRALEGADVLRGALGQQLFDGVIAVRRGEEQLFAGMTPEEIVEATRWRY
ncbi:glutamine synthetase family protein [Streptomyces sp. NBC_01324]|uniref:glutamine synthetase family protein n=1 Tax=Streptomyces sp. NBC_01324 TaxID=2903826 RepID=UPI002E164B06|nr:glutamine synthetase family protein [Streptomyces sp. NBC_01324]